ncbi:PBECR4 domain-containing protein [Enterococcus cecorum]|uniref:PBECR4 domain-containing protein n=1 Tax=Enterococcus cecorum TaxID=44008 RepID=UPI001FAE7472|nr:PBECR4 domain-containing protein [Enterococcus cecorum]MCJ0578153.1 PBECR4 domain-containing protein [Enterococcus cecorum]MCJ0584749.1 PBECR4 domain-containing protein [Enterococcus cecorum]
MSNQPPNSRKNDYKQRLKVAKNRNILDVAQALGMNLEKRGGTYVWSEHDSLVIFPKKNNFKWFSQDVQGDPITLVEQVKNVEFKEALNFLNDPSLTSFDATKVKSENKPFRYFLKEHSNPRLAKDFLVNVRGLHPKTVDFFMDKGVLAQSSRYHKADQNSEPVVIFKSFNPQTKDLIGATLQGINENWEKYPKKGRLKEILANSSGDFGVHVDIGTPKKLIFFESAIDMMSYYELKRPKINDARLVAMNGLNQRVISNHLKDILAPTSPIKGEDYLEDFHSKLSPQSKQHLKQRLGLELIIAVDNDEKGKQFIRKLGKYKNLPFRSDVPQAIFDEEKMDWNEYLSLQNQLKNGYRFPTQNEQQIVQGYIPELQKVAEYYQTNLSNQNLHFVSAENEYHVLPTTFNARHFSHLVGVYFLEKEGENVVTLDSEKLLKDIIDSTINYKQIAVTKNFENTKKKLTVLNKFPDLFDVKTLYLQDFSKIQQSQNNHAVYHDALRTKDKELLLGFKDLTDEIGFMVPYTLQNTAKPRFERKLQNVGNTEPVVAIFAEENTSNGKQLNILSVDNDYFQSPEQLESLRNQMLNRILGTPSVQNHIDNTQQAYFSLEPSPISNMEPEIEAEFQEIENNQRNEVQQPMNEDFLNDPRFNEEQKEVLLQGVDRGVDISIYADPTFNSWQMKEILTGLENKLDVSIFAEPEFNDAQMEQIREGLEQGLDVSIYAKPEFDELQMAEIKYGLSRDIDVSIYANPKFDHYQMEEIAEGLIENQNVSIYANPEFHHWQMKEIRLGLLHDVDVTVYADPRYNDEQMEQIREGLENHLTVEVYADPEFDANQMEQIRLGLEQGIDAELYAQHNLNYNQMERIRMALEVGNFNDEQLYEIGQGIDANVDVTVYARLQYDAHQMEQIREGLEQGIDVRSYADPNISADEMEARRNQAFKELETEMNRSNTHWIVEKNEGLAGYQGKLLTQDLLDEIKAHDAKMFEDGELDYYKFYFDKVQDDQTLEHIRLDVGDGLEVNKKIYEYLENEIASYDRVIYESVEQAQKVIEAMRELPLEFRNKLSNVGEILSPYDIQYNNRQFQLIDNENNVVVQEGHPKRFLTRSLEAEHLVRLENGVDSYPHYDFSAVTREFGINDEVTKETIQATNQLLQEEFPELFNEEVSSTVHPYDQVAEALRKLPIYDKQNENLTLEDFLKLDTDYEILSYHEARHRAENIFIPDSLKTDNYYLYNAETGDIKASAKTPTVFLDSVMDLDEWRVYSSDYSGITDSFGLDVEATKRAYETALQAVELQYRPIEENYTQVQTELLNNLHNFVNNSTDNSIDYGYQQRLHQEEVLTALKQLPVWDDNEMYTLDEALSGSDLEMYTVVEALNDDRINISQAEWERHFASVPTNTTIEDNALLLLDMNNYPEVEILVAQRETEKFVDELTELDYFIDYDTELDFTRKFDFSEVDNRFGLEKNATRNAFNQAMMGEFLTTKQEEMLQSLTYSLDDNSKSKDIDLLHTFQLEKDWKQLSSEEKTIAIDTLSRKVLTFDEQHRMEQILELGSKDPDYMVRSAVADTGKYLDYFITDPNDQVRGIVAAHGVALDYLINDPEDFVRYSIAMQGYGLDKAMQYIKENGVEAGDETPIAIMEYGFALEDFSKDTHYRHRAVALGAGVYGESIREDILLDDDPRIRNMALKARDTLLNASKESKLEAIEEMHIAPPYSYPYGALLYDKDQDVLIALAKHNYGLDVLRHHENPEVAKFAQERADKLHMFVLEENNQSVEKELTVSEKIRDIEETYLEKSNMPQEEINKMVAEYIHDESIEVRKALAVHGFGLQELVHDENSSIRYLALRSMAMAPSDDISELTFKKIYHQDPDPIVYDNNLTCYDAEVPMINGYYVCYTIFTDKDLGYAITLDDLNQVKNTFQTELYKRNDNQVVRLNAGVDFSFIAESDSLLKVPALEQLDRVIIQGDDSQALLTPKNKLVKELKDVWNAHFEQQRKQAQTHPSDEKQEALDKLTVEQGINNIVQKAFDPENLKAENIHSYALNSIKEMTEKPADFEQFLDSASNHPELSLQNIALIEQQWENAKEVKTFRDWQNTKEGIDVEDVIVSTRTFINRATGESKTVVLDSVSVKAGEKAQITLYEPVMKTMIPVIDPNGNQMVNEQGKTMYKSFEQATSKEKAMVATGELKQVSIQAVDNQGQPIYQTYKAFELSQTNLKPESYDKVVKQSKETYLGQERNIVEGLKDVAKEMGMTIAIDTTSQLKGNEHYKVDNEKKMILVSKNDAIERQMQSAVSALAQVALDNGNNKRPTEFSKVEKDLADQLISRHLGLQADKPSDSLTNAIRQMDDKELTISLRRAQVVSKKVIQGVRDRIQQANQQTVAKNMNVSPMLGQNKGRSI